MTASLQPWAEETLKAIGIVLGTLVTAWGVRRRISQDNLVVQKADGEAAWMADIRREREECLRREREVWAIHQKTLEELAAQKLRNTLMQEKFDRLEREIAKIKKLLLDVRPDLAPLLTSDFGALPDMRRHSQIGDL